MESIRGRVSEKKVAIGCYVLRGGGCKSVSGNVRLMCLRTKCLKVMKWVRWYEQICRRG